MTAVLTGMKFSVQFHYALTMPSRRVEKAKKAFSNIHCPCSVCPFPDGTFLSVGISWFIPDNSPWSVQSQGFSPTLEVVSPLCRYLSSFLLFRSLSLSCHFISWLSELVPKVLEFFQLCLFFEGFPPGSFRVSGPSLRPLIYFWVGLGTG